MQPAQLPRNRPLNNKGMAYRTARTCYYALSGIHLPVPDWLSRLILYAFIGVRAGIYFLRRILICEPLFKAYCTRYGRRLRTGVFLHWVQGRGILAVGNDVTMDGKSSILYAARYAPQPELVIGDRTFVGHNCVFVVGKSIRIGNDCLISTDVSLRDCDSHPIDPVARSLHLPAPAEEVRPIIIGNNVWIGTRAIILKGVHIQDNSIVGAGAVVTKDVPANTVVAGNPARVVRKLDPDTRVQFPEELCANC